MSNRPRLLLVGPLPPPAGGMANQTQQLKRQLEMEGMVVSLVRTNEPYRPKWVASWRGIRALFRLGPYLWKLWSMAPRADVVHVMANSGWAWYLFALPAIGIARKRGRKIVVNYRGGQAREFLRRSALLVRAALRGTQLVVPSAFLREVFADYGIAAAIIPNVVDANTFHPAAGTSAHRDPTAPHVVIARNLEWIYGIDLGLRALAIIRPTFPALRVSVAGSGPERTRLEALASELGMSRIIYFTGRLDLPGMVALYQSADLVLNPVRVDNTPNSVLEALACGVPVVSTNVGGLPYLVEHERTAWLAEPESPRSLAAGMVAVLQDDELRSGLVQRGRLHAQAFSWLAVKDLWVQAYRGPAGN